MNYSQYDEIAKDYDSFFCDDNSLDENEQVASMLSDVKGRIYDIGCGTGLLTEIINTSPSNYRGVDPSGEMLNKFIEKHPEYLSCLVKNTFEKDNISIESFDWVVSLFGSISYVNPKYLSKIELQAKNYFLMFYKENYYPVTYTKANVKFDHYHLSISDLNGIFKDSEVNEFNNYIVVYKH